ncbi:NB-ARC domain protein [Ancylostoma duodenale]|uniref:NB-ARC domain protein n=1 Tax=Ancylostoma duodenale TaxID=51022 RepID=A0A0C2DDN3_9BILA|nr:NB-ARC domain protein [Ancylostoma duodenale]
MQMRVAKMLRERADLDSFFIVLHGIAGSGKSSLAAALFAEVPDLLGNYFESVIWLRDSSTEPSRVRYLFADLLLMLWDDVTSDPPRVDDMSSVYLYKQIQEALIDRPNVIIVLDDVVQKETVKFANQLGLRVLATTRNAELFAGATCSVDVIHVGGVTAEESKQLFAIEDASPEVDEALSDAFMVCSGNIALLNILKKLSAGRADRLLTFCRRLKTRGLSAVTATTAFEYESMHAALSVSVERLPACDRDTLACAIWALVVPVDVVDADESEFLMLLSDRLTRLCENGDWLSHNKQNDTFRFSRMVEIYLRETVEAQTVKYMRTRVKNDKEKTAESDIHTMNEHSQLRVFHLLLGRLRSVSQLASFKWNRLFGGHLSRKYRTLFDEWNVMETYQPRAISMGHLFDPEPPTPFPGDKESTESDSFKAMRDAHYANEFTYIQKMEAERKAMEASGQSSTSSQGIQQPSVQSESMRIELNAEPKGDEDSYREI